MSEALFPILLKLRDRDVAVVGGGGVAARKVEALLACDARVTVIAPRAVPAVEERAARGEIRWIARAVEPADLDSMELVVAATGDPEINRRVRVAAHERRLMVNAVDDPDRCDFYLPSVVRRGDLVVAISTSGASPAFARDLAQELGRGLEPSLGALMDLMAEARAEIQRRFADDPARRLRLSEALVRSDARARAAAGDLTGARRVLMEIACGRESSDEPTPSPAANGDRR